MLYIKLKNGLPVEISDTYKCGADFQCCWDWTSLDEVQRLARYVTAMTGDVYLGVDKGDHISPRFNVVKAPKVGEKVSRMFNGDAYPAGEIVKITKGWQITTSTGKKFRQVKQTGSWREVRGPFWLIAGHVYEKNPHF